MYMTLKPLFLALAVFAGSQSFGQFAKTSFFGPVAKPASTYKLGLEPGTLDSNATKEDVIHIISAVGVSSGSQMVAGVGPMWLHLADNGSGGWTTQYGAGIVVWAAGSIAPSVANPAAFAVGPVITLLDGWLTLGGAYDFINKKPIAIASVSYSFLK